MLSRLRDALTRTVAGTVRIQEVSAHCDLPCGVYDPAQARIEAESVKKIIVKVEGTERPGLPHPRHPHQGAAGRARQAPPVGAVDRLLQGSAFREVPESAPALSTRPPSSRAPAAPRGAMDESVADQLLGEDRGDLEHLLGDQEGLSSAGTATTGACREAAPVVTSWGGSGLGEALRVRWWSASTPAGRRCRAPAAASSRRPRPRTPRRPSPRRTASAPARAPSRGYPRSRLRPR